MYPAALSAAVAAGICPLLLFAAPAASPAPGSACVHMYVCICIYIYICVCVYSRCWSGRADGRLVADCGIYDRGAPADPDEIDKKDNNNCWNKKE